MTRQLMVILLTLILTVPVIAETETSQDEWWTSSFRSQMDNAKTCEVGTRLALEESGSNTPRTAVLMASYSSAPGNTPKLSLVFVGDQPASNTISVRFDAEPVFTPPTVNDYAVVIFPTLSRSARCPQRDDHAGEPEPDVPRLHSAHLLPAGIGQSHGLGKSGVCSG